MMPLNDLGPKQFIASIDIDAQNGFTELCPHELPVPDGQHIISALNAQANLAQYRIGSKDAHPDKPEWLASKLHPPFSELNEKNMSHYWPKHCVPGTKGFQLITGLPHPSDYDYFIWKGVEPDMHPYGICFHDLNEKLSTGLIEYLHAKNITTVIVGGLATDYCVKISVLQLLQAKFKVILNLDACRGIHPTSTQAAIKEMCLSGAQIVYSLSNNTEPL